MGVGNEMQTDDAAGLLVIRAIQARLGSSPDLLLIEGGMAPENFTGKIRAFNPDIVLFIDAAEMGLSVGEIQWLDLRQVDGFSASSHILPISVLSKFIIQDVGCKVMVIGIQAQSVEMGEDVSLKVLEAVKELADYFSETYTLLTE